MLNSDIGLLTGSVQAGFIFGTLCLAVSSLADRFRASLVFSCRLSAWWDYEFVLCLLSKWVDRVNFLPFYCGCLLGRSLSNRDEADCHLVA